MKVDRHTYTVELLGAEGSAGGDRMVTRGHGRIRVESKDRHRPRMEPMHARTRRRIGWFSAVVAVLLLIAVLEVWPAVLAAAADPPQVRSVGLVFGALGVRFAPEVALLLMVALVGALGSMIELIRRFTTHAGRGDLSERWGWWYALRPLQGAALALVFYFVLRGGLLGVDGAVAVNPYGIAATAGVVGLFARHAISRLDKAFDAFFGKPQDSSDDISPVPPDGTAAKAGRPAGAAANGTGH